MNIHESAEDYLEKILMLQEQKGSVRSRKMWRLPLPQIWQSFGAESEKRTISVSKTMQRANKDALEKLDLNQVYHTFPDRREGSKSSLILKKPKTKKSNRVLYMTKPLKEELQAWLEKLKQDEQNYIPHMRPAHLMTYFHSSRKFLQEW